MNDPVGEDNHRLKSTGAEQVEPPHPPQSELGTDVATECHL